MTELPAMKSTQQWSELVWWVECPHCSHAQGGEQCEFDLGETVCEKCEEHFEIENAQDKLDHPS